MKRITLDPEMRGSLSSFGYAVAKTVPERRAALATASRFWGPLYVIRKLGAVAGLHTRTHPSYSKTFRDDQHWVSATIKPQDHKKRVWREVLSR